MVSQFRIFLVSDAAGAKMPVGVQGSPGALGGDGEVSHRFEQVLQRSDDVSFRLDSV